MSDSWTPPDDHPISIAEAKNLMAGDYGRELLHAVSQYVAPIYWIRRETDEPTIVANGTVFFLDTGQETLVVTAGHVYEDYCRAREQGNVRCQIFNLDFDPEDRLIDRNATYDIATFRIEREEIREVCQDRTAPKTFLTGWPPCVPEVGRGILFAGYPGNERLQPEARVADFGLYAAAVIATEVGPRNISYQIDRSESIGILGDGLPPEGYDPGGISGGPVLTLVERDNFISWRLGGVIYEASPTMEIILAARAEVIQPDGHIVPA